MKNLIIQGEYKIPDVKFDVEKGILEIAGKSIPDRAEEFYKPIVEWLDNYLLNPCEETIFNFKLMYFNTGTERYIFSILKKLESCHKSGNKITVNWFYQDDDEDMLDVGEDYQDRVGIPIILVAVHVED